MRKLIVFAMFTMFAGAAAAQDADRGAGAQLEAPVSAATEVDDVEAAPDLGAAQGPAGEAQPFNDWCYDYYAACTADCLDMVGNPKGACLRACRFDLEGCLGN